MEGKSMKQHNSSASILCPGHTRTVVGLDCSANTPDGVFFVSACLDGKPMLREAKTGNWIGSFIGHEGAVWSARVNKGATLVATASADFTGRLWNATNGSLLHSFPQKHIVKAAAISEDSSLVAFGGKSKEVNIYSTSSYDLLSTFHFDEEVAFLEFCPLPSLSTRMICVGLSGKIVLFDSASTSSELHSIQLTDIILDVSLSGDLICLATCHGVRFLSWDLVIMNKKEYPFHTNSCDVNRKHTRYLVSDIDTIYEVDYQTHEIIAAYHGHHGTVHSLRYCSEGDAFISGSDDSSIRLWMTDRN
ncbi:uncharacterized protein [Blastocystis hominis]|uniref:Serine-threonine kinase receptor-associated protein n=1 Tax=Blastocystis hominis TaxID=12968 RepID=D8LYE9_BLAHO|nr:uncharacterized protein [Blastocystis hominis]CBK20604.2 unnamed protein product [Blastocystis hominis]|eukprot:XP_012894652.1 uncharacterized protein [Blastocystis hominis]